MLLHDLHKIALEEILQLPLSCRVGQVANVETATLGGAGRGSLIGGGLIIDGGIAQSVGNVIDGGLRDLLHGGGSRHDDGFEVDERYFVESRLGCLCYDVRT